MEDNNKLTVLSQAETSIPGIFSQDVLKKAEDWEDFISLWTVCDEAEQLVQWYRGDIANKVVIKYGEESLEKFAKEVGVPYPTIIAYRRTSRAFKDDDRLLRLSWTHYFISSQADSWDVNKQEFIGSERFKWAEKAHDEGWSVGKLRLQIAEHKAKEDKELFQFYLEAIKRFGRIITHWEIEGLTDEEKRSLSETFDDISRKFRESLSISQ